MCRSGAMRPCKDRILRGIGGVAGVEAHADGVCPGRLHHVAELAGKEVHRAVVLDGNLDAQVLREWRDQRRTRSNSSTCCSKGTAPIRSACSPSRQRTIGDPTTGAAGTTSANCCSPLPYSARK
jgi:hypothetical protein